MLQLAKGKLPSAWTHETTEFWDISPNVAPRTLSDLSQCIEKDTVSLLTTPSSHTLPAVSSSCRPLWQIFVLPTSVAGLPSCVRSMQLL